jgi:hypothetical protein
MINLPQIVYAVRINCEVVLALAYPNYKRTLAKRVLFGLVDTIALVTGGFFHELGPAQMLYLFLVAVDSAEKIKPSAQKQDATAPTTFLACAAMYGILRWGGFY